MTSADVHLLYKLNAIAITWKQLYLLLKEGIVKFQKNVRSFMSASRFTLQESFSLDPIL